MSFIGSTGLHIRLNGNTTELGYCVNTKCVKLGVATENVMALTKVGFEIEQLDRIQIHCASDNIPI